MRPITIVIIQLVEVEDSAQLIKKHIKEGMPMVGFHYMIEPDGLIKVGRAISIIGNHYIGENASSIGIACIGQELTKKQESSIDSLLDELELKVPEMLLFNATITWNFNGINEDGSLKTALTNDGVMWTALDAQMSCFLHTIENHPDVVYVNAVKHFVDACIACYGNMKDATIGSGKQGKTFTNESSHWNDTGCRVMARAVLASIDFLTR